MNGSLKLCQFAAPPGYQRTLASVSPTLAPFVLIIDAILEADRQVHVKQLYTAVRIGPAIPRSISVKPTGYIYCKKIRFHYFCLDMLHSDACFIKSYPTEDTESLPGWLSCRLRISRRRAAIDSLRQHQDCDGERIDGECRTMERRIQLARFPVTNSGYLRLHGDAEPEQISGAGVGTL